MTDSARDLPMTEAEYLEFEQGSEVRHEFENGVLYAMAGDKKKNNRLAGRIYARLLDVAEARDCFVYIADTRVTTQQGDFYYPDVVVSCHPDEHPYIEDYPCAIFEVLSPTTEARDRKVKLNAYTYHIPALHQYFLVSSEERKIEIYTRAQGGIWSYQALTGEGEFTVQCLETPLTLEQIYKGINLQDPLPE